MEKIGTLHFHDNVAEVDGIWLAVHPAADPLEGAMAMLYRFGIAEGDHVYVQGTPSRIEGHPVLFVSGVTKMEIAAASNLAGPPQPIPASVRCKECQYVNTDLTWVDLNNPEQCQNRKWPPHSIKLL